MKQITRCANVGIDEQAEREGKALRGCEQRQNVNRDRNRYKADFNEGKNKFDKLDVNQVGLLLSSIHTSLIFISRVRFS